jgi:hypothetical protein
VHRRQGHTDRTFQYQVLGTPIGAETLRLSTARVTDMPGALHRLFSKKTACVRAAERGLFCPDRSPLRFSASVFRRPVSATGLLSSTEEFKDERMEKPGSLGVQEREPPADTQGPRLWRQESLGIL